MKLKSVSLKGYRGIPNEPGLTLMDFGHRNIFIGPNNSGKSTVFRFLHHLKSTIESFDPNLYVVKENRDDSWWWQHDTSHGISASLVFSLDGDFAVPDPSSLPGKFVVSDEWRLDVLLRSLEGDKYILIATPLVYLQGQWCPVVKQDDKGTDKPMHLNNGSVPRQLR